MDSQPPAVPPLGNDTENNAPNPAAPGPVDSPRAAVSGATPKRLFCTICRRFLSDEANFCPKCGRSRALIESDHAEIKADMAGRRAAHGTWLKIRKIATYYVALLILNFVAVFVLPTNEVSGLLLVDSVIIIVSFIWSLSTWNLLKPYIRAGLGPVGLAVVPLSGAVIYALTVATNWLALKVLGLDDIYDLKGTDQLFGHGIPLFIQIISVCVVPGIFEEIFFRGLVQGTLETLMPRKQAWVVQAVIFAIAHINWLGFFTYLVFMGLYLGWLRNKTKSLLPGMLAHFTHNLIALLLEFRRV